MRGKFVPTVPRKLDGPRYSLEEMQGGLVKLSGLDRSPVFIQFGDTVKINKEPDFPDPREHGWPPYSEFPYTAVSDIVDHITRRLIQNWEPDLKPGELIKFDVFKWMRDKVGKRVNKLVFPYILQYRNQSRWYLFQKHYRKVVNRNLVDSAIYQFLDHEYLAKDFFQYRVVPLMLHDPYQMGLLDQRGWAKPGFDQWRKFLCFENKPYRAFNLTVDNFPALVPWDYVLKLRWVPFFKPLTQRDKLMLYLDYRTYVRRNAVELSQLHAFFNLVEGATREDFAQAVRLVATYHGVAETNFPKKPYNYKTFHIQQLGQFCAEFDGTLGNRKSLTGLVRDVIAQHRQYEADQENKLLAQGENFVFPLPPIPLPEDPRIIHLADRDSLIREATQMQHCVSGYTEYARTGQFYYFHIEYEGETATVEIDMAGSVNQAFGPRNQINRASKWGKDRLTDWGWKLTEFLHQQYLKESWDPVKKQPRDLPGIHSFEDYLVSLVERKENQMARVGWVRQGQNNDWGDAIEL